VRIGEIDEALRNSAFTFFYWFSRFEFSLKENGFLKSETEGKNAEAGWDIFVKHYSSDFEHTEDTKRLLFLNPKRQKVGVNKNLEWQDVGLTDCQSELSKVVRLLKTIRNNLFHGGKHGADGWDNPERTRILLVTGKNVLDQLAELADFTGDYEQLY